MDTIAVKSWWTTHLELGRVSNITTVFSNVALGYYLSGAGFELSSYLLLGLAGCLFYLAGMYLNDYCDRNWDKKFKNDRPIVQGRVDQKHVLGFSILYFLVGLIFFAIVALPKTGFSGLQFPLVLIGTIILYDLWHKNNPVSPVIMGLCRGLLITAVATSLSSEVSLELFTVFIIYVLYTISLTYIAKFENSKKTHFKITWKCLLFLPYLLIWQIIDFSVASFTIYTLSLLWSLYIIMNVSKRPIGQSVTNLIAGMILIDMSILSADKIYLAVVAIMLFTFTLKFQKIIKGT